MLSAPPLAESAKLLGVLIASAPSLVLPYTAPILKALVAKLRAAGQGGAAAGSGGVGPLAAGGQVPGGKAQQAQQGGCPCCCGPLLLSRGVTAAWPWLLPGQSP